LLLGCSLKDFAKDLPDILIVLLRGYGEGANDAEQKVDIGTVEAVEDGFVGPVGAGRGGVPSAFNTWCSGRQTWIIAW